MANGARLRTVISMHEDTHYNLFSIIVAVAIGVVVGGVALTLEILDLDNRKGESPFVEAIKDGRDD